MAPGLIHPLWGVSSTLSCLPQVVVSGLSEMLLTSTRREGKKYQPFLTPMLGHLLTLEIKSEVMMRAQGALDYLVKILPLVEAYTSSKKLAAFFKKETMLLDSAGSMPTSIHAGAALGCTQSQEEVNSCAQPAHGFLQQVYHSLF
jgi:hypothetical protein